jgi:hypothetical protein
MTRQEKIDKAHNEWDALLDEAYAISDKADTKYKEWQEAIAEATDDPEPQADDVETILALAKAKDILSKRTYIENDVFIMHALNAALTRLSAPVDVHAKAEMIVDAFNSYMHLMAGQKTELFRLIVEQFS